MANIRVSQFRVGESNYNYIVYNADSKVGVVIDPLEAAPVMQQVNKLGLKIPYVLNTHGHMDHIAGNDEVVAETGAELVAGAHEEIPHVKRRLNDNDTFRVDGIEMKVMHTPGHTAGHVCLNVNDQYLLVGDTLFLGGCGNCKFGGNPDQLFESLGRLVELSDHLKIYCGHEYAVKNLEFCQTNDPRNPAIAARKDKVLSQLRGGENPETTLGEEKQHNVFLRCAQPAVWEHLRQKNRQLNRDPRAIFKYLRELRNTF